MIKKYDFVKVIDFYKENHEDKEYLEVGKQLVGSNAMVIGFYSGDKLSELSDYDVEICFFNQELQELAMEYGFDYWDVTELEVL